MITVGKTKFERLPTNK